MNLSRLTQLLSALSDPTRAKIFFHVLESPEPLHSKLIAGICDIREGLASYHLKELTDAGWLARVKTGKYAMFMADRRTIYEVASFFCSLTTNTINQPTVLKEEDSSEERFFQES